MHTLSVKDLFLSRSTTSSCNIDSSTFDNLRKEHYEEGTLLQSWDKLEYHYTLQACSTSSSSSKETLIIWEKDHYECGTMPVPHPGNVSPIPDAWEQSRCHLVETFLKVAPSTQELWLQACGFGSSSNQIVIFKWSGVARPWWSK